MVAAKRQDPSKPFVNLGFFNAQTTAQGDLDDMSETLDYAHLAHVKDIYPAFRRTNQKGIGIGADQLGLLYNTQQVSTPPTSWGDPGARPTRARSRSSTTTGRRCTRPRG